MTIFDKDVNKVLPTETVNEVDKEKNTKESITSLSRDNTNYLQDDNVENIDDINELLMIEAQVTKK